MSKKLSFQVRNLFPDRYTVPINDTDVETRALLYAVALTQLPKSELKKLVTQLKIRDVTIEE